MLTVSDVNFLIMMFVIGPDPWHTVHVQYNTYTVCIELYTCQQKSSRIVNKVQRNVEMFNIRSKFD